MYVYILIFLKITLKKVNLSFKGTSLVAQWLRICLAVQRTLAPSLI